MHFSEIPTQAVHIRIIIHRAAKKNCRLGLFRAEGRIWFEIFEINAVGDYFDRLPTRNVFSKKGQVVWTADNLQRGVAGNGAFIAPHFRHVLDVEDLLFK